MPIEAPAVRKKQAYGGGNRAAVVPNPYMRRSIAWLLVANALRDKPLNNTQLSNYAGHPPKSVAAGRDRLTKQGLFKSDGSIDFQSPLYKQLSPAPSPLPDLRNAVALTSDLDESANPTIAPDANSLSPEEAIRLLSRWVKSGAAGKDAPKFIAQIMELRRLVGKVAGPPEPRSERELENRLVAILDSVPPDLLTRAVERAHDLQRAREAPSSAPETSDSPPNQEQEPSGLGGQQQTTNLPEPSSWGPSGDPSPRTPPLGATL